MKGNIEKLWQSNFTLLFASRVLKDIGDNFASIAFVWLLIERGGGPVATSIVAFCALVPQFILSTFVSPLLSRGRLQRWMFGSDFLRALVVLVVPVCYLLDSLPVWLFFVSALVQSVIGTVYMPASVALLPRIVNNSLIQRANALLQSSTQVVTLIGLTGAGALVTLIGASTTLMITSAVFVLSAGLVLLVTSSDAVRGNDTSRAANAAAVPYLQQLRAGLLFVRSNKLIFWLVIYAIFLNIGSAPFMALSAVYVSEHLQQDAATLTLMRASSAVGSLLMGIVLARFKIVRQGALFTLAGICSGISFLLMGETTALIMVAAVCFLLGTTLTAINVPEMVIVQTTVPPHQQAQVFSLLTTLSFALTPVAILLSGPLAAAFGPAAIIAGGGALSIITGILIHFLSPLSKLHNPANAAPMQSEAV